MGQDASVSPRLKRRRILLEIFYPIFLFGLAALLAETTAQIVYRLERDSWRLMTFPGDQIHGAFQKHPYLVGVPTPDFSRTLGEVHVSHDAHGHRGPVVAGGPGVVRIVAIGGSTTYAVNVSDDATWPAQLGRDLGPGYQVINLGVPGYSTVEHVIQTAFHLSDLAPAMAIYFVGWNDLRNSHVAGIAPDYANFHAPYLHGALGLFNLRVGNRSALLFYAKRFVETVLVLDATGRVQFAVNRESLRRKLDVRVLSLYRRNLESIIALCRQQGIRPILVPQLFNSAAVGSSANDWTPTIADRDLQRVVEAFNRILVETARRESADVVTSVLETHFEPDDFVDVGHFSAGGNQKFARVLATFVRSLE